MYFYLNLYIQVLDHTSSQLNSHQAAQVVWKKRAGALVNSNNASNHGIQLKTVFGVVGANQDGTSTRRCNEKSPDPGFPYIYIYMCVCS